MKVCLAYPSTVCLAFLVSLVAACDAGESSAGGTGGSAPMGGSATTGGSAGTATQTGGSLATGGQSGTGGDRVMNDPSKYSFNTVGAKYPFPQGRALAHCTFPAYNTDNVATAYTNWKMRFFSGGRVVRPENSNDTVSEGIAYGMLIGVYMNDRPMFDQLWAYAKAHFDNKGLMNWQISASGGTMGSGSATDADADMAWALAMASVQWGGSYASEATTLLNAIWTNEVEAGSNVLKPGDNFGGSSQTNPSYFTPSYYKVFGKFANQDWQGLTNKSYEILAAASGSYGLVPNWVNSSGSGVNGPGNDANGLYYGYDAARTPFRIALDYCQTGEPRAKAYLDKLTSFFGGLVTNSVSPIKDGYTTTGANPPGTLGDYSSGMVFWGPIGVAALSGGHEALVTASHQSLVYDTTNSVALNNKDIYNYFQASWGVLSLLAMSGNFWDMTQ
jgi:endo-1,4-beta-D-glucanase Y